MLVPSIADRLLAKKGIKNETTNQRADHHRPDNLFEAGRGDPRAHGRFDGQSRSNAFPFNPTWLRAGLACIGLIVASAIVSRSLAPAGKHRRGYRAMVHGEFRDFHR